ncbi:hypothetical protein BXZ70DRAFT_70209 [Cristinia sonorae]|uniref:Clp1 n=1 Tax=Cristinia sonorae TaxID=1940300 RepID=A0A8K0UQI1_9AGAR|nr:hypothetical protein BXZ70DRAFT_70209 [Cristinia sonorae]
MFQVASRPAAPFSEMSYNHYQPTQPAALPSLNLPERLKRPAFKEVSRNSLLAVDPTLPNYPVEFIKHHLKTRASEMRRALSVMSIMSSLPRSHLPSFLDVPLMPSANPPNSSDFPTHLLAISASKIAPSSPSTPTAVSFASQAGSSSSATVPLYPAHALVLAAHCTALPPLPIKRSDDETAATMRLPIVPLTVPNGETFPPLHAFLHDKRADKLLAFLLPSLASRFPRPAPSSGSSSRGGQEPPYVAGFSPDHLYKFAQELVSAAYAAAGPQGAASGLMAHTKVINSLWANTCALGITDEELWSTIDFAWTLVITALATHARDRY